MSGFGITVYRTGGGGAAYINELLATGQVTTYVVGDDGDYEAGDAKAYTVNAIAGTSDIQVAHLADSTLSFTAPNTIASAGNLLAGWAVNDRMVIKGSANNDGEVLVTGVGGAPANLTIAAAVNELAGAVISLYKVAALSNNIVLDTRTGLTWARYTSNGLKVGAASNGTLNWYDVATRFTLYNVANSISVIMPGNIFRITGGAALTQFHVGDCLHAVGFANAVNLLPFYRILSVTPNAGNLDIVVQPNNQVMVAEGAVGDTLYLNCRSIFNFAAGANLAPGLGGYSDWRNPNRTELQSIQGHEAPAVVPDPVAFPGWPAGLTYIWSTTTRADNTVQADAHRQQLGDLGVVAKTSTYLAALVRLGT